MPVLPEHGLMHRMHPRVPRHREVAAGCEVDEHRQALGRSIEIHRLDRPR
jgi:hypothetical protein